MLGIDLSGKAAVVTGGGGGIGFEIARILSKCGASVAINDISAESAETAARRIENAIPVVGSVTDEADVERMFEILTDRFGTVDIVVNNAGRAEPVRSTVKQDVETWRNILNINLEGPFLVSRSAAAYMKNQDGGTIVNIASVAGIGAFPASNAYGVSKAALIMMTKTMACELARFNIRVNAIAPGTIEAPMAVGLEEALGQSQELFERRIPMGRLGVPSEVAHAVAFLVSDLASYISGVVLPVDGGWTAFGGLGDASRPAHKT